MKKLFTLVCAVLTSFSLWAEVNYHTPEATSETFILDDYLKAEGLGAPDWWLEKPGTTSSIKCGDPANSGAETSAKVTAYKIKGNNGNSFKIAVTSTDKVIVYHNSHDERTIQATLEPTEGDKVTIKGAVSTLYTEIPLDKTKSYQIVINGIKLSDGSQADLYCYAIKLETTSPAEAICPSGLTISGKTEYGEGDKITLTAALETGNGAITYQWYKGGVEEANKIEGATAAKLEIADCTVADAGNYFCVASKAECDDVVNASAYAITVNAECPSGLSISGIKTYAAGAKIVLTASLETGTGAITYQWYKGGVEEANKIEGATAAKLEIADCTVADAGNYFCVASKAECEDAVNAEAYTVSLKDLAAIYGEIITATLTSGTAATVTGAIGGTADVSLSSSLKMDKGKYFGIALGAGNFQEGDTVVITMTTAGGNYPCLFSDKNRTNCLYLATEGSSDLVYKIVLPAAANTVSTLYLSRGDDTDNYKWNPVLSSISVIRPVAVKSTVETLTAVTINDDAISAANLSTLISAGEVIVETSYLNAPVVKFTKHTVITYEDESTKESDEVIEKTSTQATASTWGASATIGNNSYTVYTLKTASYVVTYKLGSKTLGTENVAQNGSPANYATYQTLNDGNLSTFKAWYTDADLAEAHKVANIAAAVITEATTFYAEFEYKYATSINIESLILEHGKSYNTKGQLGTQNYASNYSSEGMDVSNDSLNNDKGANRNYDYLGLKVKSASLLNFRLAEGKTVKIKLGNVGTTPKVSINGGDYATISLTDGVYTHEAEAEELISFWVTENNKAVVIKQIVIGDAPALEDVVYAINCADATNGTVSCNWALALPKEMVALTVTPASGYVVSSVKVNNAPIEADAQGKYSFQMPAADANVAATFSVATALDNTDDAVKATKRIVNGQLIIEKNGETYNILGTRVR